MSLDNIIYTCKVEPRLDSWVGESDFNNDWEYGNENELQLMGLQTQLMVGRFTVSCMVYKSCKHEYTYKIGESQIKLWFMVDISS